MAWDINAKQMRAGATASCCETSDAFSDTTDAPTLSQASGLRV